MAKLFFSYSHKDEQLRDELEVHLAMLKRQSIIETWHDRKIGAGKEFDSEICKYLEESNIILLLISPYFIASDYCYDIELSRSLEMHKSGEATVIPIILHPCDWHSAPFGKLTACPVDGKAISTYSNQHEAFLEVTQAIRNIAESLESNTLLENIQELKEVNKEKSNLLSEHEKLTNKFNKVKETYKTEHKELTDWLSKNKTMLVERIFSHVKKQFENQSFVSTFPATSREIRTFKRDISQNIRHFEVCLLENNTEIIDEPSFIIGFDHELYKAAYSFLFERVPNSVPQKSKEKFRSYIEYLLNRI